MLFELRYFDFLTLYPQIVVYVKAYSYEPHQVLYTTSVLKQNEYIFKKLQWHNQTVCCAQLST